MYDDSLDSQWYALLLLLYFLLALCNPPLKLLMEHRKKKGNGASLERERMNFDLYTLHRGRRRRRRGR